jgi:hypothetical protein
MVTDVRMLGLNFDQVLSVLHGWLDETVSVGVSVTPQPLQVAQIRGRLQAGSDMHDPYDEAEWEFTVGDSGSFAIGAITSPAPIFSRTLGISSR